MELDDLTVLNDLKARLVAITQEQVESIERRLDSVDEDRKKERIIGSVTRPITQALWTLTMRLLSEMVIEDAKSKVAIDELVEQEHRERAAFLDMLADVSKELFWAQAKIDCGFHKRANVGIRRGWVLVAQPKDGGIQASITRMLLPGHGDPDDEHGD